MNIYPLFLVLDKDGKIHAYAREDILKVDLAQNAKAGDPARAVFRLVPDSLTVSYERIHDYAEWTVPLENLCRRHLSGALQPEFHTANICAECEPGKSRRDDYALNDVMPDAE